MSSTGPAIRAVCRIINQNSCGSGSVCGYSPQGGSYVLTNAHVAGTRIGRQVVVEVESLNRKRFYGKVIRAAYTNNSSADWALLHVPELTEIKPVYLTRELPKQGESMYTKGFPRCQPHDGTDIEQQVVLNNGVLLWSPNAIGGQSGSGVWGDNDHLQKALLTWSMNYRGRWWGAGQLTAEIYKQNRDFKLTGTFRAPIRLPDAEYVELPGINDFDFNGIDRSGLDDPEVKEGIFSEPMEQGIQDYPIWEHMVEPEEPEDPEVPDSSKVIKSLNNVKDAVESEIEKWNRKGSDIVDPSDPENNNTFGL